MPYSANEIFYKFQGEGRKAGRAAVFFRFSDCNVWPGREAQRAVLAFTFCDTGFAGTDGPGCGRFADLPADTAATVAFCMAKPTWRLSLQTYKHLGIR